MDYIFAQLQAHPALWLFVVPVIGTLWFLFFHKRSEEHSEHMHDEHHDPSEATGQIALTARVPYIGYLQPSDQKNRGPLPTTPLPRRKQLEEEEESISALDVIVAAEVIQALSENEDDPDDEKRRNEEAFSFGGGQTGGAGASGDWDDPAEQEEARDDGPDDSDTDFDSDPD